MTEGLSFAQIREMLPHGHPMILVDRIAALVPGERIVGIKVISACEPCYAKVAAGAPLSHYAYPASLLLESFGQTAAVLWLYGSRLRAESGENVLMFAVARNCVIEGSAHPGDVVRHEVRPESTSGANLFVSGTIWSAERRIACIESMAAALRPRSAIGATAGCRTGPELPAASADLA